MDPTLEIDSVRRPPRCRIARRVALVTLGGLGVVCGLFSSPSTAANCAATSTGLVPLTDLGSGTYLGYSGGLYPGGQNVRPPAHDAALLAAAAGIVPRDASGTPDPANGKIGFTTMGMSNTSAKSQSFGALLASPAVAPSIHPKLVFFTGAQGGKPASSWANPNDPLWTTLGQRVVAAGLTNAQVQVVWVLQAEPSGNLTPFPGGAVQIKDWLVAALQTLKTQFPNLRVAYLSSRVYAGYASTQLNPEPFAYETGFAKKWLIEEQINGDPDLVYDGPSPKVPVLAWGPYLWTDGLGADGVTGGTPGRGDGLEWECAYLATDGTHPSGQGSGKAAQMLLDWLTNDPSSQPWFLADAPTGVRGGGRVPSLAVTPNPARTHVTLTLPEIAEPVVVGVYDVTGRRVAHEKVARAADSVRLTLPDLPSGVYYVRVTAGGNRVVGTTKIAVVR